MVFRIIRAFFLAYCLKELASPIPVQAQIRPDLTLPNNSLLTPNGNTLTINGGTTVGTNLFHSFEQFSVLTGQTAFFNNALNVQNILARITGSNTSQIDGLIQANGNANLFLLNPNGMIFGPNAQLRIGGSFIGTTADSIILSDGTLFSAINPQAPSLLAVNVPLGLQFGTNPGSIINQSLATGRVLAPPGVPISNKVGLAVPTGQTLALIGGDIALDGGNLTASNGQILLGSVNSGVVGLNFTSQGLSLNYDQIQNFGNISLTNGSLINTSGLGGGKVELTGGNVTLSNGRIYALTFLNTDGIGIDINSQNLLIKDGSQIFTIAFGAGKGGGINFNVTDSIEIIGVGFDRYIKITTDLVNNGLSNPFDPQFVFTSGTLGTGNSGNLNITTRNLQLRDGVIAGAGTSGTGRSGDISIQAGDIEIIGSVLNNGSLSSNSGVVGNINIEAQNLILQDGGNLSSTTNSNNPAGDINIKASESVQLFRTPTDTSVFTIIATNGLRGTGKAGNITIETKRLIATEGSGISAASGAPLDQGVSSVNGLGGNIKINATESIELTGVSGPLGVPNQQQFPSFIALQTSSPSKGGNLTITTPVLTVQNGGLITTGSFGGGEAGTITIDAKRVQVIGSGANGQFISKIEASVGNLYIFPNPDATAAAGSIKLNVDQLLVQDGARVTVSTLGTGKAGNINLVAKGITLDHQASINASTGSGAGGNINLKSQDIFLRRGSQIVTNAENTSGGNITINTGNLVAVPVENSDITANAQKGNGGRISITADGIFGIQFRDKLTPLSDITATSDLGPSFNGTVQIDLKGIDVNRGLLQLPESVIDPSQLIAKGCNTNSSSHFVVTGNGGLPEDPRDTLRGQVVVQDLRPFDQTQTTVPRNFVSNFPKKPPLIEATAWVIEPDGTVQLVAKTSNVANSVFLPQTCQSN